MTSEGTYDKLEETGSPGDKAELLDNDGNIQTMSVNESPAHSDSDPLKKPKKVLEAGKAVLQDQSRGLRIIVISAFVFSVVITVALILSIYLGPPQIGANSAVATGIEECSNVGLQMLEKGGNAVDAAVASMFCMGVINAEISGLGGGGFMLVHDHKIEKSEVFDFRETAPAGVKSSIYKADNSRMKLGATSVAVPGELMGMEKAHTKYGKLAWKYVVAPAADIARNGFKMTGHTDMVFKSPKFREVDFMESKLADFYTLPDGTLKKEGDTIVRPDLAATLDKIAAEGSDRFYHGSIANDIVKEISINADIPGALSRDDLAGYTVEVRDVVKTTYHGYTIESVPAPGSGPVVLSIMNFLESYSLKQNEESYHRILEAFKFGYAQRELLGDPKFNSAVIYNATKVMISKEESTRLRNMTSNVTMDAGFYGKLVGLPEDKGTAHISVIDTAELMVSVTTTINDWFGSMVLTDSGILLNNEMADFNKPGEGSVLNEIYPGKRPLSSMSPTVVYETGHLCGLRMVCGAANGTRIITGIAQTLLNNLTFGMTLEKAVSSPRIHSQLQNPDARVVEAEEGYPQKILDGLAKMGHVIQKTDKEQSIVNAVLKIKDDIEAVTDDRKKGSGPAMFH
ncbi:glutathione hydrolase 1 proenzyme-like [Mercenaria mercenaria]|uniref:glutathione hydrolase 1 proenzyme-like n=1 Tax=Mercenaria mercenaria TaxID=6596 RepID=UPI00234F7113|nr:glutathione hydrolase 1 proenzyme-like [Mercenaria mercenaria]